jgi:hypothetical protein
MPVLRRWGEENLGSAWATQWDPVSNNKLSWPSARSTWQYDLLLFKGKSCLPQHVSACALTTTVLYHSGRPGSCESSLPCFCSAYPNGELPSVLHNTLCPCILSKVSNATDTDGARNGRVQGTRLVGGRDLSVKQTSELRGFLSSYPPLTDHLPLQVTGTGNRRRARQDNLEPRQGKQTKKVLV